MLDDHLQLLRDLGSCVIIFINVRFVIVTAMLC